MPDDWHPEERGNAYAAEQGFSTSETADIAESFREHWHNKPGKDGRKIDWSRAWQTWVRNERRFRGEPSAEDLGPIDTSYVMPEELARKRRELKGLDEPRRDVTPGGEDLTPPASVERRPGRRAG